jgi:long-chain acyl-CoA synthetase
MATELTFQSLIELFNKSLCRGVLADKHYLEVARAEREETLTFGQLRARAREFALWLIRAKGIRIGDKITILGKNRADWDVAFWGTVIAGAVPVLIDPERRAEGVKRHVLHTDSRLIVMADDYQDDGSRRELREFASSHSLGLIEMTSYERVDWDEGEANELLNEIGGRVDADETAVILCTSGTTADPREVELTHGNIIANIQGSLETVDITGEDKLGHITPPHHSFGLTVAKLLPLWIGATNVYTDRYRQIPELIRDKSVTVFVGVPALFAMVAKKIEEVLEKQKRQKPHLKLLDRFLPKLVGRRIVEKLGWDSLRFFLSGAAPVPRWVLEVFWRRGLQLYEGYGTTENSPVYGFNSDRRKLGSVGRPITTLSVKIVDEKGETLGFGETGEIALGGPCIMKGYYRNPEATEAVIRIDDKGVRWLHTGDLGYLDDEGCLFITGRKKYVIVLPGGKNVNPELVEAELSQAEYVREVLVVADFHQDSSGVEQEVVKAIVQPDWDVIEKDTKLCYAELVGQPQVLKSLIWDNINKCQQRSRQLSHFEKVASHRLEIKMDEFQKTSSGKIKRELYIEVKR